MMQERKIRLAIFVVIGLLVGGIILDASHVLLWSIRPLPPL